MRKTFNVFALFCLLFTSSCLSTRKIIYFRTDEPNDSSKIYRQVARKEDSPMQPDDILGISVTSISSASIDKSPVSIFNEGGARYSIVSQMGGGAQGGGGGQSQSMSGSASGGGGNYLIDPDGNIDYPVVGKLKVGGLSIREIKALIAGKLVAYIKDPVVEVRIINFKVTVLGEVATPGQVIAPNTKLTILDAIASSGEIPITGRKDNVLVIRENNGQKEFGRLNLNSSEVFTSPYFYLKQNDIVYVEPSKVRRQENNTFLRFYLPTFTTLLSTGVLIYSLTRTN